MSRHLNDSSENSADLLWDIQPRSSRRQFIGRLAAISAALTVAPPLSRGATPEGTALEGETGKNGIDADLVEINLKVNGHQEKMEIDPRVTLLDAIRDRLDLTGTKKGCEWRLYGPHQRETSAFLFDPRPHGPRSRDHHD